MEELATSTARLAGVSCSFICPTPIHIRDNAVAVHLFRIAQEALSNALKHGRAKNVVIALEAGDGLCSLRVSDGGIGFDPSSTESKGMGLSTMRYRARELGGKLEIHPNYPSGVVVNCTIEDGTQIRFSFNLPILVLSMHDESLYAERVLRAGATGYITKNQPADEVLFAVRRVLTGEVYVSEKMTSTFLRGIAGAGSKTPARLIDRLTDREFEVLQLIGRGQTTRAPMLLNSVSGSGSTHTMGRNFPTTSQRRSVIWPSEQCSIVLISSSKALPSLSTTSDS